MSYAIQVEGLVKCFGATTGLAGVDFEVAEGTVLGLLGPNGWRHRPPSRRARSGSVLTERIGRIHVQSL